MATFIYRGPGERTYPGIVYLGHTLVVNPGDVCEFDVPPGDGLWFPDTAKAEVKADD